MSPAGITIGHFMDVRTLGPVLYTIKVACKIFVQDNCTLFDGGVLCPFSIKNVTYKFADLLV